VARLCFAAYLSDAFHILNIPAPALRPGKPPGIIPGHMNVSLARRLFRTLFAIGLVNVIVTLVAVEFVYEDMEETILRQELAQERRFFEAGIQEAQVQSWHTALLTALYVPDGATVSDLPEMFVGREAPFSAEIEIGEKAYLISIERTAQPPGVLYLSQDITLLENREDLLQAGMLLLGAVMLLVGFVLAHVGTGRIVGPLRRLTQHIARIGPDTSFARIETRYDDKELAEIVTTLNDLLDALHTYIQREKSLVSLASHELRTPVTVITGALDVLEQRNSLSEADRIAVERIRRAADEMRADVEALLKLARHSGADEPVTAIDLVASTRAVIAALENGAPEYRGRVACHLTAPASVVQADPALVRMLLRNLIQNALRHTPATVRVDLGAGGLNIADEGPGLPEHIRQRLTDASGPNAPGEGLGLFIVRLICERLGWALQIHPGNAGGTVIQLHFPPVPPVPGHPGDGQ
jgi:signal transduction histidine kinase